MPSEALRSRSLSGRPRGTAARRLRRRRWSAPQRRRSVRTPVKGWRRSRRRTSPNRSACRPDPRIRPPRRLGTARSSRSSLPCRPGHRRRPGRRCRAAPAGRAVHREAERGRRPGEGALEDILVAALLYSAGSDTNRFALWLPGPRDSASVPGCPHGHRPAGVCLCSGWFAATGEALLRSSYAGAWRTSARTLASEVKPSVPLSSQNEIGVCPRPSPSRLRRRPAEAGAHLIAAPPAPDRRAGRRAAGTGPSARLAGEAEEVGWHGVFVGTTCAGGSRLSRSPSTPPPALSGLGTRDLEALRRILKSATTRK